MNYSVIPIDKFKKEAKRLVKKYPSLKTELLELNNEVSVNPKAGTALGNDTYKIRLAIKRKRQKRWSKSYYLFSNRK